MGIFIKNLADVRRQLPSPQSPLILCHGVFDILHAGHLNYFEEAKLRGGWLCVSITQAKFINKGPGRPYFDDHTRVRMLEALEIVDFVVIAPGPTAIEVIEALKPDAYVKGPDYRDHSKDVTGEILNEIRAVESHGGKIIYTDTPTFSSSTLVNRFSGTWSDTQREVIAKINDLGGYAAIEKLLNQVAKLKIRIVGEDIMDTYRFVEPQNISSKSPSISAKFIREENYEGGSRAIWNHLKSFVDTPLLVAQSNPELTCRKIRYIDHNKQQRMFEVTHIDEAAFQPWSYVWAASGDVDVTILADFGHGLFGPEMLEACSLIDNFVALNVQTNSSNYGFNPFTKHSRFDYLSIDLREARVAFHDNTSTEKELIERVARAVGRDFAVTLGSNGAQFNNHRCPAFADQVVDATGAGDAFFAITSLLAKLSADPEIILFVGNVFAGLKTKIIGNKASVTKAQLLKACESILK